MRLLMFEPQRMRLFSSDFTSNDKKIEKDF